jgi:hypothetical protein
VDNLGIDSRLATPPKSKNSLIIACICFFLLLFTWLSIPHGATGDMDYHMASIWCAHGEKDGLCADIDRTDNTAKVPFMFQMCDSRNIDFWPYCEFETVHPETQRLRMAPISNLSAYYRIVHILVDEQIQTSVAKIRLVNSLISTLVLFALLSITTKRIRFAAVAGLSFSMIPFGLQHFSGVTTRGWALLGVMTSWAFLASFLQTPKTYIRLRLLQIAAYALTFLLALLTRVDALVMVLITSLIVIITHLILNNTVSKKRLLLRFSVAIFLVIAIQYIPQIINYANFSIPQQFGTAQYVLFQLVHIPEYMADWWNYGIGQGGSGPGVVGLIGVLLFVLNLGFALQRSDLQQRILFIGFTLLVFTLLAKSSSVVGSLVPLTGFYTLGLAAPWLGTTITNSQNKMQFMSTQGNRRTAIFLLSFSHAVFFYDLLEFYTKRGVNVSYFETISLNNVWWWDIWIGPNMVFIAGATLFPLFLSTMWRTIPLDFPEK